MEIVFQSYLQYIYVIEVEFDRISRKSKVSIKCFYRAPDGK